MSGGPQGLNHYAYVKNNLINFNDPTGHVECEPGSDCNSPGSRSRRGGDTPDEWMKKSLGKYGITADDKLSYAEKRAIGIAASNIGHALADARGNNESSDEAFRALYKNGVSFEKSDQKCGDCWGETFDTRIVIYSNADVTSEIYSYNNFLVHEMGHAFDNTTGGTLTTSYGQRADNWYENTDDMYTGRTGFAPGNEWIQGIHSKGYYEVTVDMFLGWTYGQWNPREPLRGKWMDYMMSNYFAPGITPGFLDPNVVP